ncbi:MAG: dihydropteroate synthase [Actinomycetota bacterium]|nr:dihydropteroate synthase [Actinomycetota bacterium]
MPENTAPDDTATPDGMFLYGVVNASPDSLNTDSVVDGPEQAVARATRLLAEGANGLDVGGQGSTDAATVVPWEAEWERLREVLPALAALRVPMSVDTWRPEVLRRALQSGATVINAADGMQSEAMWQVATEFDVPIVVPFLSGPNPRAMEMVRRDPVEAIVEFFDERLRDADRYGLRDRCVLDPGTGFAPSNWPWEERYLYQKQVYGNLAAMRVFGLPLYIALPWKETAQHDELLEIVIRNRPEFGRVHYPAKVRAFERRLAAE